MLRKIKAKLIKWIWKDNEWCALIDRMDKICEDLYTGKATAGKFILDFKLDRMDQEFEITISKRRK